MSKGRMDTIFLIIYYLNDFWTPILVFVGLFQVHETTWLSMASQLRTLFEKFDMMHNVIAFVKDEGSKLINVYGDNITFHLLIVTFETSLVGL
jgi:hypothetical protein